MLRVEQVRVFCLRLDNEEQYLGKFQDEPSGTSGASDEGGYRVREPWRSLYSPRFETLLVQIVADDGTVGWGEALAPVGPRVPGEAVAALLRPVLVGRTFDGPRPSWLKLRDLMRERGHLVGHQADALAAVDIALWDLHTRAAGISVATALGGASRTEIPCYVSGLPRTTNPERVELARSWVEAGFRLIKLHLGLGVDTDLDVVDAVLDVHPDLVVAVDAHWAYGVGEATRLARALESRRVAFLEAPLAPEDVEGHRDLARRTHVPIAVGESLRNRFEFTHWLGRRAMSIAQPDVGRTGISEALAIAEIASGHHAPVALHHSVGLGVALAAGLQVSAALGESPFFEFQPTTFEVANRILSRPIERRQGCLVLPEGSGLGVEVDEEYVMNHGEEL